MLRSLVIVATLAQFVIPISLFAGNNNKSAKDKYPSFNTYVNKTGNGREITGSPYHHPDPSHPGQTYEADIPGKRGTAVDAFRGGKVVSADPVGNGSYGKNVVIKDKRGDTYRYGHLDAVDVKPGKKVKEGKDIGKLGSTGNSSGPHVHVEERDKNGKLINPRVSSNNVNKKKKKKK